MRLLDTTGRRGRLASSLVGKLLARSLSSSRLTGGLNGTRQYAIVKQTHGGSDVIT